MLVPVGVTGAVVVPVDGVSFTGALAIGPVGDLPGAPVEDAVPGVEVVVAGVLAGAVVEDVVAGGRAAEVSTGAVVVSGVGTPPVTGVLAGAVAGATWAGTDPVGGAGATAVFGEGIEHGTSPPNWQLPCTQTLLPKPVHQ
jgi:hypothetical protein